MAKKIKPITAWAVVDNNWMGDVIEKRFYIYFNKKDAQEEALTFDFSVIPVRITPINPKSV